MREEETNIRLTPATDTPMLDAPIRYNPDEVSVVNENEGNVTVPVADRTGTNVVMFELSTILVSVEYSVRYVTPLMIQSMLDRVADIFAYDDVDDP
jgi:hypothetical protein